MYLQPMLHMIKIANMSAGQAPMVADSTAHWFDFHRMLYTPGEWTAQVVQIGDERESHLGCLFHLVYS